MKWKVHAIVIAIITVLVLALYAVFKPSPQHTVVMADDYNPNFQLTIVTASWGLNCNALYSMYKKHEEEDAKRDQENVRPKAPAVIIQPDNVLDHTRGKCDKRSKCSLRASADEFGDIFTSCAKDLTVSWRCFSFDKLRTATVSSGDTIDIDCEKQ